MSLIRARLEKTQGILRPTDVVAATFAYAADDAGYTVTLSNSGKIEETTLPKGEPLHHVWQSAHEKNAELNSGCYTFKLTHAKENESKLAKLVPFGTTMVVLVACDNDPDAVIVKETIDSKSWGGDSYGSEGIQMAYIHMEELQAIIMTIIRMMRISERARGCSSQRNVNPEEIMNKNIGKPSAKFDVIGGERRFPTPFSVGHDDLDPLGGAPMVLPAPFGGTHSHGPSRVGTRPFGGSKMDAEHRIFGAFGMSGGEMPNPYYLPSEATPPGARFDPITPGDVPQRRWMGRKPHFSGEPDPDELQPPGGGGYMDMFS